MKQRETQGTLVLAFVAVVTCFVLATTYTQIHAREIDEAATGIASTEAPSIEYLAAARAELHQMQLLLGEFVDTPTSQADEAQRLQEIRATRLKLDAEIQHYRELPAEPGEVELGTALANLVQHLDRGIDKMLQERAGGRIADAQATFRTQVRPSVDLVRETIMRTIELNGQQSRALALKIQRSRSHEEVFAFGLDALSIGLTGVALALSLRVLRRYTGLRESHQQLLERRAEELELFSGRVAHDILSPLQSVALFTRLVAPLTEEDPRLRRGLERADAALDRVKKIVRDLLEFARAGARPSPDAHADVTASVAALEMALRPDAEEAGITLSCHAEPGLEATCAEGVLTSLLQNLVRNAIKYMGDSQRREIDVRATALGDVIHVEVEDTGPGLPPGMRDAVFQPYVRGHGSERPGIGLGLATVKRLAESHGGRAGVTSSPRGSLFWFELPGHMRPAEAPSAEVVTQ